MKKKGIMIAAVKSGSGKTTITCAFLRQLLERGMHPVSFKCGPDYIDPMFHERVLHIPSKNLDTFFSDADQVRALYAMEQPGHDIAVLEGVMGLFDGLGGTREEGSSYHLAETLGVPVVLVIDAHGMGRSMIPLIAGFLQYDKSHLIKGVILNRTSKMFFDTIAPLIERELKIKALGCLPNEKGLSLSSRHLGLILPEEVEELNEQLKKAGELLEQYVDLDAMVALAEKTEEENPQEKGQQGEPEKQSLEAGTDRKGLMEQAYGKKPEYLEKSQVQKSQAQKMRPRIAVAMDEAFCFYYRDNLNMLEYCGAEIVPFSPLHDGALPEEISGLLLGGGYPELYAKELAANESMKASVREALKKGMPSLAECGGFMYLHESLTTQDGETFSLVGAVPGTCSYKGKLVRFGYVEITEREDAAEEGTRGFLLPGQCIRAHEFHYFDSTANGESCVAVKPVTGRSWNCIHGTEHNFWGFPHLYYPSDPGFVRHFLGQVQDYAKKNRMK